MVKLELSETTAGADLVDVVVMMDLVAAVHV
jgi:hypothetical protein